MSASPSANGDGGATDTQERLSEPDRPHTPDVTEVQSASTMKDSTRLAGTVKRKRSNSKDVMDYQYTSPAQNAGEMRGDLKAFGFSPQKVKKMMRGKDEGFDSIMQPCSRTGVGQKLQDRAGSRGGLNEQTSERIKLVLGDDKNWVLYDCLKEFPSEAFGMEGPPALFSRNVRFEPGNTRIVEYNVRTGNVRVKSTPPELLHSTVEYTLQGPKLVDLVEIGPERIEPLRRGRGRPTGPARGKARGKARGQASSNHAVTRSTLKLQTPDPMSDIKQESESHQSLSSGEKSKASSSGEDSGGRQALHSSRAVEASAGSPFRGQGTSVFSVNERARLPAKAKQAMGGVLVNNPNQSNPNTRAHGHSAGTSETNLECDGAAAKKAESKLGGSHSEKGTQRQCDQPEPEKRIKQEYEESDVFGPSVECEVNAMSEPSSDSVNQGQDQVTRPGASPDPLQLGW